MSDKISFEAALKVRYRIASEEAGYPLGDAQYSDVNEFEAQTGRVWKDIYNNKLTEFMAGS